MNENAVFFDHPANRTVDKRDAKTVNVWMTGHEKRSLKPFSYACRRNKATIYGHCRK